MTTWRRVNDEEQWQGIKQAVALGLASLFVGAAWMVSSRETSCEAKVDDDEDKFTPEERKALPAPGQVNNLKLYTKAEVAQHISREAGGIWVTYKDGVYDITEFIESHPGGASKILLAAGKAIDPYWNIFQQHFRTGFPLQLLESMRVGSLAPGEYVEEKQADPYAVDPIRDERLILHNSAPCNAEIPEHYIMESYLTPNELWFVRHHNPVPIIDPNNYTLTIKGKLQEKFPKHEVDVTIQCSGNRRSHFDGVKKAQGIPWNMGGVSTARFGGARLKDVLEYCGVKDPEKNGIHHVQFISQDEMLASIPIEKAFSYSGDVLLAYEMNGEEIPTDHGYPVRAVVPGYVGVRNVKWVKEVFVSEQEAEGPWQRGVAYKGFASNITDLQHLPTHVIERAAPVQEPPVTSLIVHPANNAKVHSQTLEVRREDVRVRVTGEQLKGWAYSGGGRGIVRVEVSIDGGKSWHTAELKEGSEQKLTRAWAWTFWSANVEVPKELQGKSSEIMCRATDASYNSQPEHASSIWNVRGLCNTAWHRKTVHFD
ncbi:sulfite oxidase [Guillardia theta CCMP2712]|uniref:sulfite oxidase n=1 Tax=Guillardia theta (strain CCMP2712) TaxID=905079 RepID=L1JBH6_GUITC|nr:sulfite oxidase [Guillardia theta CCMP2712]EKX45474.1 sulfite oxidase [Guillardia theta CCMP2712]|eukprot:XP_005832454.1 sulfite oxidase [Guillardia theta CCMP2712]